MRTIVVATSLLLLLGFGTAGCPKKGPSTDSPSAADLADIGTEPGKPFEQVRYQRKGGLSSCRSFSLTYDGKGAGTFVVRPTTGPEKTIAVTLEERELAELQRRVDAVNLEKVRSAPREQVLTDIGRTMITLKRDEANAFSVLESPQEAPTADLGVLRKWLDAKVNGYIAQATAPAAAPAPAVAVPAPAAEPAAAPATDPVAEGEAGESGADTSSTARGETAAVPEAAAEAPAAPKPADAPAAEPAKAGVPAKAAEPSPKAPPEPPAKPAPEATPAPAPTPEPVKPADPEEDSGSADEDWWSDE